MRAKIVNFFKYGETTSKRFGMKIFNDFTYKIPQKDLEYVSIPGVSGDVIVPQNRYKNFGLAFHCRIFKPPEFRTIDQESTVISKWLNSQKDYSLLYFSLRPDYLYEAFFDGETDIERETDSKAEITIGFQCLPFVLRQEGLNYFDVVQELELINPDDFTAKPIIKITPNGFSGVLNFSINEKNYSLNINDGTIPIFIDSRERYQRVYQGTSLLNNQITTPDYQFPELALDKNKITVNNTAVKFEIQPRWRTLG